MQEHTFTKAEVSYALDKWATSYAAVNHVSLAKAYVDVLSTDAGRAAVRHVARRGKSRAVADPGRDQRRDRCAGATARRVTASASRKLMPPSCRARRGKSCTPGMRAA